MELAGAPLGLRGRSAPTFLAESEVCCSRSAAGAEGFNRRSRSDGSKTGNCGALSRRRGGRAESRNAMQSAFWDCKERWRTRDCRAVMLEGCADIEFGEYSGSEVGSQRRKGQIRVRSMFSETKNPMRGASFRNALRVSSREGLGQPFGRQTMGWRLYAVLDPYETLGVPDTATEKEIKRAYRKLALKFHPDVNKQPDAQQKFMQIKNAYQMLMDEESRAKNQASRRKSPSWNPFSWEKENVSTEEPKEEPFYGFDDFFRDLRADSRRQASKPKSLWEELADIGEEFVEFLEKELNISDTKDEENSGYDRRKTDAQDSKKRSQGAAQSGPRNQEADKAQVETEIAAIEDMLARLKEEMGI